MVSVYRYKDSRSLNKPVEMFLHFNRRGKIKFVMGLKRKRSASSSSSPSSNGTSRKRRATTPAEDSLLGAHKIYKAARKLWKYRLGLTSACTYAMDKDPSFSSKLVTYSNSDAPEQRMASMMKDPWLDYILGLRQSDAFIRGFVSILIAYWNMKAILDKHKLVEYGRKRLLTTTENVLPSYEYEVISYAIDHVDDIQNLREVLDSKYGSDPDLAARLLEQISDYQLHGMDLADMWTGKRAMISIAVIWKESRPPYLCKSFYFST